MAGKSREPVVGMDEIGSAVATDVPRNSVGEVVHDTEQLVLRHVRRASVDVDDTMVRLHLNDIGQ